MGGDEEWGEEEGARLQVRQTLGAGRLRPEGQLLGKKVLRGLPRHPLKPYTRGLTWRLALTLLLLQSASRLASSMFVSVFVCVCFIIFSTCCHIFMSGIHRFYLPSPRHFAECGISFHLILVDFSQVVMVGISGLM